MGNEQAVPTGNGPSSNEPPPKIIPRGPMPQQVAQKKVQTTHELLIVVRGQRYTGKTTLVKRMKGGAFSTEYEPTSLLDSTEIPIQSEVFNNETVNVKVWDVVEKALMPPDMKTKIDYPDASTIDTFKRTDGLVIIIDVRHPDTVQLAEKIIDEAPSDLPIILFSNFQDEEKVNPVIPELLASKMGRFTFLPGSLKTNQGLLELSKWLQIPYTFSKKKLYMSLVKSTGEDLEDMLKQSYDKAANFLTMDLAMKNLPKIPTMPQPQSQAMPQQAQQPATTQSTDANKRKEEDNQKKRQKSASSANIVPKTQQQKPAARKSAPADDGFFSDDDGASDDAMKLPSDDSEEEPPKPNPLVQAAVPKKQTQKTVSPRVSPVENKQKKKPAQRVSPKSNVPQTNDGFFSDDDDGNDDAMKLPSDESDDEPVKPNPLVQAIPKKQVQKTVSPKVLPASQQQQKKASPVAAPKKNVQSSGDGFFSDGDDDDDAMKLPSDDSDDEPVKPNPFVQPVQTKKPTPKPVQTIIEQKKESPKFSPVPADDDENVDDLFGDDDNDDDDTMKLPSDDSDDEPVKPNALVQPVQPKKSPPVQINSKKASLPKASQKANAKDDDDFFGDDNDEDVGANKLDNGNEEAEEEVVVKKLPPIASLQKPQNVTQNSAPAEAAAAKKEPDNLPKRHRAKLRRH